MESPIFRKGMVKQNMKKTLALLVALTLCVSVVGLFASCSRKTVAEDTKWIFTDIDETTCSVAPGKLFKAADAKEIPSVSDTGKTVPPFGAWRF